LLFNGDMDDGREEVPGPSKKDLEIAYAYHEMGEKGKGEEKETEALDRLEELWESGKKEEREETVDPVTGLPLVDTVEEKVLASLAYIKDIPKKLDNRVIWSVLVMDGNHFKEINDNLTHGHGDDFLKGQADGIRRSLREQDLVYRSSGGGDEIMVLLRHSVDKEKRGDKKKRGRKRDVRESVENEIIPRIVNENEVHRERFVDGLDGEKQKMAEAVGFLSKGVGTLAMGIRHYTVGELKELIEKWEGLDENKRGEKGFLRKYLLEDADVGQMMAKTVGKLPEGVARNFAVAVRPDGEYRVLESVCKLD